MGLSLEKKWKKHVRQRQEHERQRDKKPSTIWKTSGARQTWSEKAQARMMQRIRQEQSRSFSSF